MPHKIVFRVVAVSGEDDSHRARELNIHGPTVQGWQSPRFCTYPQEIILQLENRSHICKIQVLSHQYLIATQIKISVGDGKNGDTSLQYVKYKQLGYISLSDNERTNFKARELKSVHVDVVGTYIRFVIHKNHVNSHNPCNQVGIVAINVIGDEAGRSPLSNSDDVKKEEFNMPGPGMVRRRPELISPLDDLTFDMYQDPEVAQIIRKLENKKQEAVRQERYEFAKKLKIAITDLYKAGETLGKYEIEKQQAINMEDYDKARRKKTQMEEFRLKIYEQLELPKLMEMAGRFSEEWNQNQNQLPPEPAISLNPPVRREPIVTESMIIQRDLKDDDDFFETVSHNGVLADDGSADEQVITPLHASNKPLKSAVPAYTAYEERALPGPRNNPSGKMTDEAHSDIGHRQRTSVNHMTEHDKRQSSLPIEVFGISTVQLAYSKTFSDREESLDDVRHMIMTFKQSDMPPAKIMRAATFLTQKGLKDIVLSVFGKALDLLTVLLLKFPVKMKVPKSEISHTIDKTVPELILKLGDKAQRQRTAAHQYILEMMDYPEVGSSPSVPLLCCQPLSTQIQPRLAQGLAELVEQLVNKIGIEKNSGLTLSTVMHFAVSGLQHPSGPVREASERIITSLYREKGPEVRRFLPPGDTTIRKNMIYRHLFETFEHIDDENQKRRDSIISNLSGQDNAALAQRRSSLAALPTPDLVDRLEKTCIFCNEKSDSFTDEGLDVHYWKHCPMLMRCSHCKQVVEISGLTEHLLEECSAKNKYSRCQRCQEAILKRDYDVHTKLRTCIPARKEKGSNRCPLCHKNIGVGDKIWKTHLMGRNGCENNPRRNQTPKAPHDQMKKSQSADRALTIGRPEKRTTTRISRSTTRTFNTPPSRWR